VTPVATRDVRLTLAVVATAATLVAMAAVLPTLVAVVTQAAMLGVTLAAVAVRSLVCVACSTVDVATADVTPVALQTLVAVATADTLAVLPTLVAVATPVVTLDAVAFDVAALVCWTACDRVAAAIPVATPDVRPTLAADATAETLVAAAPLAVAVTAATLFRFNSSNKTLLRLKLLRSKTRELPTTRSLILRLSSSAATTTK